MPKKLEVDDIILNYDPENGFDQAQLTRLHDGIGRATAPGLPSTGE